MIDFYGKKDPNATEENVEENGKGTNINESKEQQEKNDIENKNNENGANEDNENKENEDENVMAFKDEFKNKSFSIMLQSFAAVSSFLCNIGAFV